MICIMQNHIIQAFANTGNAIKPVSFIRDLKSKVIACAMGQVHVLEAAVGEGEGKNKTKTMIHHSDSAISRSVYVPECETGQFSLTVVCD